MKQHQIIKDLRVDNDGIDNLSDNEWIESEEGYNEHLNIGAIGGLHGALNRASKPQSMDNTDSDNESMASFRAFRW